MSAAKIAFELQKIRLALEIIMPVRLIKEPQKSHVRYKTIVTSIKEVGLVEPLMVFPQKDDSGKYLLIDGHLRYAALKELGETSVDCIIADDDESFTYNARISRVAPIQEHKMITRAVQSGVKPERIAAALNIPLKAVVGSMKLLDGIDQEVADLLKEKRIAPRTIRLLKKVVGIRQLEIVELMISANNYATAYAEALLMGTPKSQIVNPGKTKMQNGLSPEESARMQQEMEGIQHDFRAVEDAYGENMLNFTLARSYTKKLLENAKVQKFLNSNHAGILSEFESIVATETL